MKDDRKPLSRYDWDAIVGIAAAAVAIILGFLGILPQAVLPSITLALIGILFIRHLRGTEGLARMQQSMERLEENTKALHEYLRTDTQLIGPHRLREESESFARRSRGEMIWFNVCLTMFRPQWLFDVLLKPAVENPSVTSIEFTLDENQKDLWIAEVLPKLESCSGRTKVHEPRWTHITENSVSFVLAETPSGGPECLLSFWGEPFMASTIAMGVPRYMFYVYKHSELIPRLREMERSHRIGALNS